ncbi:MAG: hypothetical protein SNJ77_11305, partial [Cytophagales bacterium]
IENCSSDKIYMTVDSINAKKIVEFLKPCSRKPFEEALKNSNQSVIYHKTNHTNVAAQMKKNVNEQFMVKKWDEFKHTTIVFPRKFVLEIEWK